MLVYESSEGGVAFLNGSITLPDGPDLHFGWNDFTKEIQDSIRKTDISFGAPFTAILGEFGLECVFSPQENGSYREIGIDMTLDSVPGQLGIGK